MHILVFEPRLSGHHAQYLKFVLQAARQVAARVTLVTTSHFYDLDEYHFHLTDEVDGITVLPIDHSDHLVGIKQDYHHLRLLKEQIAEHEPDRVWVPYVDRLAQLAGIMRFAGVSLTPKGSSIPVIGLLFRGAAAYEWNTPLGTLKDRFSLKLATLAPLDTLYTVDNVLHEYLQERGCDHCQLMPEPVESMQLAEGLNLKSELGLPADAGAKFIVSLGGQSSRKGVDLLIPAFLDSEAGSNDYLVLAGKLDADIAALLERHQGHALFNNILVRDELLTVQQIQMYLEASDFVAVPYPEHIGSSSFVIRAAVAHKPLIAADSGWIGWTTSHYQLGFTCNVKVPAELTGAINLALQVTSPDQLPESDFDTLARYHTVENFRQAWLQTAQ